MANEEHLQIIRQRVVVWNEWRKKNPDIEVDLVGADLNAASLEKADLSEANLSGAHLSEANLTKADLSSANLSEANLSRANLSGANLIDANLTWADLINADLSGADLSGANLTAANLNGADLSGADLWGTVLIRSDLCDAVLTGSRVCGVSAWDLKVNKHTRQQNLILTFPNEPKITVDDIKVAQFIYLLLINKEIRAVIDTITLKAVLILGRFSEERKPVLDALRNALRDRDFLPIVFDFECPRGRDFTEIIMTLAGMSCFIIADITNPKSTPL